MATIERTVYSALTQEANSTIIRIPGSPAIKSGVIDVFYPDVRMGSVNYKITDSTGKVTTVAVDAALETAEGVKVTPLAEGTTPGHQFSQVDCTGSVGLLMLSVVLNDYHTDETDSYTRAEIDSTVSTINTTINTKANTANVYAKADADAEFVAQGSSPKVTKATAASSNAVTALAAGSTLEQAVTKINEIIATLNPVRSTAGSAFSAVNGIIDALTSGKTMQP